MNFRMIETIPRFIRRLSMLVCTGACLALAQGAADAQGYSPDEAPRRMKLPDGLEVQLVASEPMVRQPVAIEFDDRGRLWVIQYLQYPNPAGLKRAKVDRYSRTIYDRFPSRRRAGRKGADRITILEDTDGDGRADRAKDFVSGLNLAIGSGLRPRRRLRAAGALSALLSRPQPRRRARRRSRRAADAASAWRTRTRWPTRSPGDPTAGSTAARGAR